MAEKTIYRTELAPEVYAMLQAETFLSGSSMKAVASKIIRDGCSDRAKGLAMDRASSQPLEVSNEQKEEGREPAHTEKRSHKDNKPLEDYPELRTQVDTLLDEQPRKTYAEIGRAVGRSRFCIADYAKRRGK